MKKKTNGLKTLCSRFLLFILAVFLCAAPCSALDVTGTLVVDSSNSPIYDVAYVKSGGTLIIKTGGFILGVSAEPGSVVKIYGGVIGNAVDYGITVNPGTPNPIVTVYGTNFKVDGVALPPSATEFTPLPDDSVLTVTYTDEAGNPIGEPVNLLFDSDIPINLVNTAVSDPAQLIEELIATVSNMNLQQGIDNSLDAKLDAALNALDDVNQNNDVAAINTLQAFINAVEAQRDSKITSEQADSLIADAQAIIALLST